MATTFTCSQIFTENNTNIQIHSVAINTQLMKFPLYLGMYLWYTRWTKWLTATWLKWIALLKWSIQQHFITMSPNNDHRPCLWSILNVTSLWCHNMSLKQVDEKHFCHKFRNVSWLVIITKVNSYSSHALTQTAFIDTYEKGDHLDQSHKSHNPSVPYPKMHFSEQKCSHFCSEWGIMGYGPGALWDMWDWSFTQNVWDILNWPWQKLSCVVGETSLLTNKNEL